MKKIFYLLILLLFSVYVAWLYGRGVITFYIHPRYVIFTYLFALLGVMVSLAGLIKVWEDRGKQKIENDLNWREVLASSTLVIVLGLGFLLPVRPLSAATASQREIDFNSLSLQEAGAADLFLSDSRSLSLGDWVINVNNNPAPEQYIGREVDVSGFAFKSENLPDGTFRLARFVVTCCAVDARPVGLLVQESSDFNVVNDKWYQIKGTFNLLAEGSDQLVVVPEEIKEIPQPEEPYIF